MSTAEIKEPKKTKGKNITPPKVTKKQESPLEKINNNLMEISAAIALNRKAMKENTKLITKALNESSMAIRGHVNVLSNQLRSLHEVFESSTYSHVKENITNVLERIAKALEKENK